MSLWMKLVIVLFYFRCRLFFFFKAIDSISCMATSKSFDVIFKRPLVLEIRATDAIPKLPTVLFMGPPITSHCKTLTTFSTHEGLDSMLPLVVCLKSSEIFKGLCSWVINVVPASWGTTIAWKPKHTCWLGTPQRFRPFSVL